MPDDYQYHSQNQFMQIQRNTHLDRLYNMKTPEPPIDTRKPSVPNYQNELILPSNGKIKQATSPVVVTPREKIDGNTKLSLEDVCLLKTENLFYNHFFYSFISSFLPYKKLLVNQILEQCTTILLRLAKDQQPMFI